VGAKICPALKLTARQTAVQVVFPSTGGAAEPLLTILRCFALRSRRQTAASIAAFYAKAQPPAACRAGVENFKTAESVFEQNQEHTANRETGRLWKNLYKDFPPRK